MEVVDIMRQAVSQFAPNAQNQEEAIPAAMQAGERLMVGLGVSGSVSPEKLRSAALEIWTLYYATALDAEFVVTSLCRHDLMEMGATEAQVRVFSDADMRAMAKKMEDGYVGSGSFWTDLASAVNEALAAKGFPPIAFSVSPDERD